MSMAVARSNHSHTVPSVIHSSLIELLQTTTALLLGASFVYSAVLNLIVLYDVIRAIQRVTHPSPLGLMELIWMTHRWSLSCMHSRNHPLLHHRLHSY